MATTTYTVTLAPSVERTTDDAFVAESFARAGCTVTAVTEGGA